MTGRRSRHPLHAWCAAAAAAGLALLGTAAAAGAARAASFVADLSDHLIAITTAFTGTDVLLFAAEVDFRDAPSYYAVAASAPLAEVALAGELERHEIGVQNLRLEPAPGQEVDRAELAAFR